MGIYNEGVAGIYKSRYFARFKSQSSWYFENTIRATSDERWRAGVETQKNVRGEIGGWGRVPFNEPYAPSLSTIYDGA